MNSETPKTIQEEPDTEANAAVKPRQGIQLGQVVREGAATNLEHAISNSLKRIMGLAHERLKTRLPEGWTIEHRKGYYWHEITKLLRQRGVHIPEDFALAGYFPDGGVFTLHRPGLYPIPFLAIEAKHQGTGGNAIERWHKNYTITKLLGYDMAMLTFATGEGCVATGPIPKTLNVALVEYALARLKPIREWNTLYLQGPSMYSSVNGWDDDSMDKILLEAIVGGGELFSKT